MKKPTSTQLDKIVKTYIIESINNEDHVFSCEQEKIDYLESRFLSEYGHEIERHGKQTALENWLMGLPSCLNIVFFNHAILELAKKWGSIPEDATEKQEDAILENYWHFMAAKILQLFNGYRIPSEIMTPARLALYVSRGTDSHFFDRSSMKFFGDTMGNYGVSRYPEAIKQSDGSSVYAWKLYRKRPVKNGLYSSAYFNVSDFSRVFKH